MRRLLHLVLLTLSFSAGAQPYQCVLAGSKQYFTNNYHYLRGMRIDAVTMGPAYTDYFPFRSPRLVHNTLDTAGGCWLGKKIRQLGSGTTFFETRSDTIVIETSAGIGASWVFYNDTSATYYTAQIVKLDTMSVLGSIDSVKTIQISAMRNGIMVSSPLNNYRIMLSRNNGFVRIFDLFNFPYTFSSNISIATDYFLGMNSYLDSNAYNFYPIRFANPRYTEIYDFTPGDIYQTSGNKVPPQANVYDVQFAMQDSIISRTNTGAGISYVIKTSRNEATTYVNNTPPGSSAYSSFIRTLSILDVIMNIVDTNYMPEESGKRFIYYYSAADTSLCTTGAWYKRQHYQFPIPLDAPPDEMEAYKTGLGLVDSVNGYRWGASQNMTAFYSGRMTANRKNGSNCGRLLALDVDELTQISSGLKVWPIPADTRIAVEVPASARNPQLALYDMTGRLISAIPANPGQTILTVSNLPAGVYLLRLHSGVSVTQRIIAIQH